ncbi:MAG TPA: DNA starvation/stationary phase protection protein [Saprospiraceae bacterium]|nr:DNA starvation/stationary phase protection protein [Saprospiraceae bacterium]
MDIKLKATHTHNVEIGMTGEEREKVATILSQLLADQHVLYLKLRNYHWNVTGMMFKPLHELFEEQYTQLATFIDDTAERIRSLGFFTAGSMKEFASQSRLVETDHLNGNDKKMVENLLRDHEAIIQILRHNVTEVEDLNDAGNADFLTALMEEHEKMAWMLRSHLG